MTELKSSVTHVDGVEVIAREPAVGPHPRWGKRKMVPRRGVVKVLLADDTERFICEDGDYSGPTIASVVNHRNGTHNRTAPRGTMYPEATMRALVRAVKTAQRQRRRDFAAHAAKELNDAGVPTLRGEPWNSTSVSRLYAQYGKGYRVKLQRPDDNVAATVAAAERGAALATKTSLPNVVTTRTAGSGEVTVVKAADEEPPPITEDVVTVRNWLEDAEPALAAMMRIIDRFVRWEPDPELEEKARKWDELRANLMR